MEEILKKINMCDTFCKQDCNKIEVDSNIQKLYQDYMKNKPNINTSQIYKTINLPARFERTYLFKGYGIQREKQNPFYKTMNLEYGYYTPSPHTVPTRYFPRSQEFSDNMAKFGMYRNYSLNTMLDKSYY